MEYLLAGLAGVVVGASMAGLLMLYVLQKRADRDLIERRVRACCEYLECLSGLERACGDSEEVTGVLDQAWWNVRSFCREFRLSGWVLSPGARRTLGRIAEELEAAERRYQNGSSSGGARAAQMLCERHHEIVRVIESERLLQQRAFEAFHFFPEFSRRGAAGGQEQGRAPPSAPIG